MYTENKPYLPFALAQIFGALPLALLLHEIVLVLLFKQSGWIWICTDSGLTLADYWQDSIVWFICSVFAFLNLPISAGLVKLAYKKMMRRHARYALFLAGVAACAAAFIGIIMQQILEQAALGGLYEIGIFCYALSVWLIARLTLPKQLTRAPVQTITFHKSKR